jgi:hypothetical protein
MMFLISKAKQFSLKVFHSDIFILHQNSEQSIPYYNQIDSKLEKIDKLAFFID